MTIIPALATLKAGSGGALAIDTGVGMTAAEVETALTPFRQVDNSLSRRHAGTGLGLPLTKTFIEMLGGSLEITSERGRGTLARLRLAIDDVEASARAGNQRATARSMA